MDENRSKALAAALSDREAVRQRLDHAPAAGNVAKDVEVVSTGSLGLDIALGVGGLPAGG